LNFQSNKRDLTKVSQSVPIRFYPFSILRFFTNKYFFLITLNNKKLTPTAIIVGTEEVKTTLTQKVSVDRIRISIILEHLTRHIIKTRIGFQTQILTHKMLIILLTDRNQDDSIQTQDIDHFYPI
jgi:hypothetical protein